MSAIHEKLSRVRPPRVHITYDVETEEGVLEKELPFVVGVLGDFVGNASTRNVPLSEREFVEIDRDNFDSVMKKCDPRLDLCLDNVLDEKKGGQLAVSLAFESMDDFKPERLAEQVPALKKLIDIRSRLQDLLTRCDRSSELEQLLENALCDRSVLLSLSEKLKTVGGQGDGHE